MGVAVEKNVPLLQRRKRCGMIEMPMGDKEAAAARKEQAIVGQNGEVEHHLIDLRVTVAADGEDPVRAGIELGRHRFGVVALGQIVPRSVIEQIPQKKQFVGVFPLKSFQQFATIEGRAVNVRGDNKSHSETSHCFPLLYT